MNLAQKQTLPHIVIVGAGFGGMEAAQKLAKTPVRITLIDRQNYHLFQPLLYQIAIAGLVPAADCVSAEDHLPASEEFDVSNG